MSDDALPRDDGVSGARILVLSASETEADEISRMLGEQVGAIDIVIAGSVEEARALLEEHEWACAVLATSES